jgi:hypothetical protein
MAQGQGDYEVEKVTCLQTSVMGYAPLIYDLKENSTLTEFKTLCNEVWLHLDEDAKLPDNFVSIGFDVLRAGLLGDFSVDCDVLL